MMYKSMNNARHAPTSSQMGSKENIGISRTGEGHASVVELNMICVSSNKSLLELCGFGALWSVRIAYFEKTFSRFSTLTHWHVTCTGEGVA
jgi:hypothetical protein